MKAKSKTKSSGSMGLKIQELENEKENLLNLQLINSFFLFILENVLIILLKCAGQGQKRNKVVLNAKAAAGK